jgi:septation ring formation regulator EzrA
MDKNELILYLKKIDKKLENIEKDIAEIKNKINNDLVDDCKKMSQHIDFIERVYDNVKNPLGYICNKLNYYTDNTQYNLEDVDSSGSDT